MDIGAPRPPTPSPGCCIRTAPGRRSSPSTASRSITPRSAARSNASAAQLRGAGLGADDRIAIVLGNGPEMALVLLAAMSRRLRRTAEPEVPRGRVPVLPRRSRRGRDRSPSRARRRPPHAAAPPGNDRRSTCSGDGLVDRSRRGRRVGATGDAARSTRPSGDDHALVLHTSGTTSRPKIVPLRQRNLAASARNIAAAPAARRRPTARSNVMPLFHIHGIMAGLLAPLSAGGSVVCTPGFDAFKFHRWVDELTPTYYSAVPTMHQMVLGARIASRARPRCASSARRRLPFPGRCCEDLRTLFGVPVVEAYGMTEASHQMTCNPLPPGEAKPGSVGIADGHRGGHPRRRQTNVLPPGERGEVVDPRRHRRRRLREQPGGQRGGLHRRLVPHRRRGDARRPTATCSSPAGSRSRSTAAARRSRRSRSTRCCCGHPAVAEAVTFAIPHDKLGEEVGAAVVLADGPGDHRTRAAQLPRRAASPRSRCRGTIVFVTEIPKGATGKIQRIGMAESSTSSASLSRRTRRG